MFIQHPCDKVFNRNARSSCAFHQPRPNITGNRSSEVPEVCSSSTRFFSSNDSSDWPREGSFAEIHSACPACHQRQAFETLKIRALASARDNEWR